MHAAPVLEKDRGRSSSGAENETAPDFAGAASNVFRDVADYSSSSEEAAAAPLDQENPPDAAGVVVGVDSSRLSHEGDPAAGFFPAEPFFAPPFFAAGFFAAAFFAPPFLAALFLPLV